MSELLTLIVLALVAYQFVVRGRVRHLNALVELLRKQVAGLEQRIDALVEGRPTDVPVTAATPAEAAMLRREGAGIAQPPPLEPDPSSGQLPDADQIPLPLAVSPPPVSEADASRQVARTSATAYDELLSTTDAGETDEAPDAGLPPPLPDAGTDRISVRSDADRTAGHQERIHPLPETGQEVPSAVPAIAATGTDADTGTKASSRFFNRLSENADVSASWSAGIRKAMSLRGADLEALIGGNWLNKIGVVALVIGIALLTAYSFQYIGAWGRIGLGVVAGLSLLFGGRTAERRPGFKLFARPLIGGGWAILYFTAYAAHAFEPSRIIHDPLIAGALLLGVAAGMVIHSLRYRSELITGMTYVLAFVAIDINDIGLFGLVAAGVLGTSLIGLMRRFGWYRLIPGGVAATYLTHALWLLGSDARTVSVPAFWIAEGVLIIYWTVFTIGEVLTRPPAEQDRAILLAGTVTNAIAFTILSWILVDATFFDAADTFASLIALGAGAAAFLMAQRNKPTPSLLYGLYAAAFAFVAIPLDLAGRHLALEWLAVGWAALAAGLIAIGFNVRLPAYRIAGYLIAAVAILAALAFNAGGEAPASLALAGGSLRWITLALLAGVAIAGERLVRNVEDQLETFEPPPFAYGLLGAAFVFCALPLFLIDRAVPAEALGIAWGLLAAALLARGTRIGQPIVRLAGWLTALAAATATLAINLLNVAVPGFPAHGGDVVEWVSVLMVIALLFAGEVHSKRSGVTRSREETMAAALAGYAAAGLLGLLFYLNVGPAYLGLIWLAKGVAALEAGKAMRHPHTRYRGYALGVAGVLALLVNNANLIFASPTVLGDVQAWVTLGGAAALLYFAGWRVMTAGDRINAAERRIADPLVHLGTGFLGVLVWNVAPVAVVGIGWGLASLAMYEIGARRHIPALRFGAYALAACAFGRLFLTDFVAIGSIAGLSTRVVAAVPVAALLYYLRAAERTRSGERSQLETALPIVASFAGTLVLFALARFEIGRADAVIAWAVLAAALLMTGLGKGRWDFRLQAYMVAIAAFARSWTTSFALEGTVWGMPERIATTVPVIVMLLAIGLLWRDRRATLAAALPERLPHQLAFIDRHSGPIHTALAVGLTALLLYYSVSGNLLTMSWAVTGLAASALGFAVREQTLRLSGLALLAICLFKVAFIDLAGVETIYRILSFIVLGMILVGVSFAYTRYRRLIGARGPEQET